MAVDIKKLQEQLMRENLDKYATESEKRTKLAMAAISGQADSMSATGKAYFEMLSKTVEASEKATGKQLKYSTDKINDISKTIQQASDLNDVERQILQEQVNTVQETFKANTTNGGRLVDMAKKTLEDNAVDVTSIVAGLTSNNPVIMFATKWIGDSIKQRREEAKAQRQSIDEAMASVDTTLVGQREDNLEANAVRQSIDDAMSSVDTTLVSQREDNLDWREDQDANAFREEEARREGERRADDQLEALEAIANKDMNVEVSGAAAGEGGGFLDNILGFLGGRGLKQGIAGMATKFGPMLMKALPIGAVAVGLGMAVKDGWDIASNLLDDDIATGIEGEDVGGLAGAATGAAMGAAIGSVVPGIGTVLGAGVGAIIGSLSGSWLGEMIDPNMDQMLEDTSNQIRDKQQALVDSLNGVEQAYEQGLMSEEEYLAAKNELLAQVDEVNAQSLAAQQVGELQAARDRAANEYNNLAAQIDRMEEAGVSVPQAMYDQLATAEDNFYNAEDAFETATDELNSQVDPSWWDSLSAGVASAVSAVTTSVDGAFQSVRNSLTGMAIPDIEGMSEDERAALQAKVNALPEGLSSVAGLTQEQLVLLAEDLEMSPEDLAAMDSAAVLRATAMDSIGDGLAMTGELAGDAVDAIGSGIWAGAEALGVDDELSAAAETVKNIVDNATEGAKAYWNEYKDKMGQAKDAVLSFFGFGDDEELTPEQQSLERRDRIQELETGLFNGEYDGLFSNSNDERAELERLREEEAAFWENGGNPPTTGTGGDTGGSNVEATPAPDAGTPADVSRLMTLPDLMRDVPSGNISEEALLEQQNILNAIEEENGSLSRINSRKKELVNRGLARIAWAKDIMSGDITEQLDPDTMTMQPVGQGSMDQAGQILQNAGVNTSELAPPAPEVGQTLNSTIAENRNMEADAVASARNAQPGSVTQVNAPVTNNSTIQRVAPQIPVRNSYDDYRGSSMPAT